MSSLDRSSIGDGVSVEGTSLGTAIGLDDKVGGTVCGAGGLELGE
jgi:hypothetical protein